MNASCTQRSNCSSFAAYVRSTPAASVYVPVTRSCSRLTNADAAVALRRSPNVVVATQRTVPSSRPSGSSL